MLDILDTAGQEEYETMQDQWFRSGAGFMLVFSVENRKSLNDVKALHKKILNIKGVDRVPLVLVGAFLSSLSLFLSLCFLFLVFGFFSSFRSTFQRFLLFS